VKQVITHLNPDLDAVASVWLVKRFLPGWEEAVVDFAPGKKIEGVDDHPEVLHVDVGLGRLDHHQTGKKISAAKLCWQFILRTRHGQPFDEIEKQALTALVATVTQIDNARELRWPEVSQPRFYFYLQSILNNLRSLGKTDQEVVAFGMAALDAVLVGLKNRLTAEDELDEGIKFQLADGIKGVAVMTSNERILWEGEARGYALVVRKDPESGGVRIYCRWDNDIDLTKVYNKIRQLDPESDWFLHASKKLLLNESRVNPGMRPTTLSLETIIKILQKNLK